MFLADKLNKGGSLGGYQISRSLRFNSADSTYLNRTPATTTNRTTFTWSGWIKRTTLGGQYVIYSATQDGNNQFWVQWDGDAINVYDYQSAYNMRLVTTAVYRDPSAWYHIVISVDTTQATASNRIKLYVNGVQVTAFTIETYPSQNYTTMVNYTSAPSLLGSGVSPTRYLPSYMTEVNFIDGQALTPSSFGETNAQTGVWQPKAYSGSYGTNGFYLNFSDNSNTTAATLGKDYSGNGNNWTPNNFSVTAGAGNDSLVDSPTSYGTDTGVGGTVRGNYSTLNPLKNNSNMVLSNGNLNVVNSASATSISFATISFPKTGKYYYEAIGAANAGTFAAQMGIFSTNHPLDQSGAQRYWYLESGYLFTNNTQTQTVSSYAAGDVVACAFDADANTVTWYKNNVQQGTAISVDTSYDYVFGVGLYKGEWNVNFGQRAFAYTAPSGFKALCTQNLPTPTIGATSATLANKYFDATLYTGTGSTLAVTNAGGFQPDWVWLKNRSNTAYHSIWDAVRGRSAGGLASNDTMAEQASTAGNDFVSFNSNGFSVGPAQNWNVDTSGNTYVGWQWKANGSGSSNTSGSITSTVSANTTSGFSIATYTSQSSGTGTVGHGLGVAPSMVIVKTRATVENWYVYHSALGGGKYIVLSSTNAAATSANLWNNTAPTSTVFSLGTDWAGLGTAVAYCFAPIAGYSAFGSYTGNGSADGPFVFTGFRPAYILWKRTDSTADWTVFDTSRDTYNVAGPYLNPNTSAAELTDSTVQMDLLSNGFKVRGTWQGVNASGGTIIFAAFAQNPFKYSLAR
jgi:hypothetical protein